MRQIRCSFALLAGLALGAQASLAFSADNKLDSDDKKWLASVEAIIQPDELKVFKSIPKSDRKEFETIFWARRNPKGPAASANEFQDRYMKALAEADRKYAAPGRAGSSTDCGHAFLVLGAPDQTRAARPGSMSMDSSSEASAQPGGGETWVYKERPAERFQGGSLSFNDRCELPLGSPAREQLNKIASVFVVNPAIKPELADGHLVKLSDMLKRGQTPLQQLFAGPRQDFTFEQQPKLSLRVKEGTYLAGVLRVPTQDLAVKDEGGAKKVSLQVGTQLVAADGNAGATQSAERRASVSSDGRVLISYSVTGAPGSYTLRLAVLDAASGKGSLIEAPVTLPDFGSDGLRLSGPQVFGEIEPVTQPDPHDALADLVMGNVRLVPRFDNVFKKTDSVQFLCFGYNAANNPASGKPAVTVRFEVFKGDKPAAAGTTMAVDTTDFAPALGPVPLNTAEPGEYRLQVTANDIVAKQQLKASVTYQVVP